jgi:hypothetical protein
MKFQVSILTMTSVVFFETLPWQCSLKNREKSDAKTKQAVVHAHMGITLGLTEQEQKESMGR